MPEMFNQSAEGEDTACMVCPFCGETMIYYDCDVPVDERAFYGVDCEQCGVSVTTVGYSVDEWKIGDHLTWRGLFRLIIHKLAGKKRQVETHATVREDDLPYWATIDYTEDDEPPF